MCAVDIDCQISDAFESNRVVSLYSDFFVEPVSDGGVVASIRPSISARLISCRKISKSAIVFEKYLSEPDAANRTSLRGLQLLIFLPLFGVTSYFFERSAQERFKVVPQQIAFAFGRYRPFQPPFRAAANRSRRAAR